MKEVVVGITILLILGIAWLFTKRNAEKRVPDKDAFKANEVLPPKAEFPDQKRKDTRTKVALITGKTYTRVYPRLPRKERIVLLKQEKYEKHALKVHSLDLLGVLWTPRGLYWKTRELAELHNSK